MTRNPDIKSINCTSCGAGLNVLGGGRIQLHVCSYCGSELDAQDNYAVLREFKSVLRPASPFSIGMQGKIKGIAFTVIGTLGMVEKHDGQIWKWVDHQLYSATHGYAYLTVENGHLTFTRRHRKPTAPSWVGPQAVEIAETPPVVRCGHERFKYFETTTSEITFIEGEFNWRPKLNAMATSVSVMARDSILNFRRSDTEEEITLTTYLPAAETYAAFGVDTPPAVTGMHALLPYRTGTHEAFFKWAASGFAACAVVIGALVAATAGGGPTVQEELSVRRLPAEIPFEVTEKDKIASIRVSGNVKNSWAYIGVSVSDPEDIPVFETGRTVERYSGRDADGSWSEGRRYSVIKFIPRQTGTYTIEVEVEEADTWKRFGRALTKVTVTAKQGLVSPFWLMVAALGFGLFAVYHHARGFIHAFRRRSMGDWTDED